MSPKKNGRAGNEFGKHPKSGYIGKLQPLNSILQMKMLPVVRFHQKKGATAAAFSQW
jgi:hypothetical protein